MANPEHVAKIKEGVAAWNSWRGQRDDIWGDLNEADLAFEKLTGANLRGADLRRTNFIWADLRGADLRKADFSGANLRGANLSGANLQGANLREGADFTGAILSGANLREADLRGAVLRRAILNQTDLTATLLIGCKLDGADLTGSRVYGASVWDPSLVDVTQRDLIITPEDQPDITVDNLEVAQFVYLLLNNAKIRDVIDTITSKAVLILGRFTPERKRTLDTLRDALRTHNYLPIVFDFKKPDNRDFTETVSILAHLARFVIADLTDPRSIPQELTAIIHKGPLSVPICTLLRGDEREWAMFTDLKRHQQVMVPLHYTNDKMLLSCLESKVIASAEQKFRELQQQS